MANGAWVGAHAASAVPAATCPPSAQTLLSQDKARSADRRPLDRGYLWRIDKDGRSSWLYGTLHLGKVEWLAPGPHIAQALRSSDTIALEIDPLDTEAMQPLFAPGDPVRRAQVMTVARTQRLDRQWAAACARDEGGAHLKLQPILQTTALAGYVARGDGYYPEFAVDIALAGYARRAKQPLVALESIETQLALFRADSAEEEAGQIDEALDELESGQLRQRMLAVADMWARSDLPRLTDYESWCECTRTPIERAMLKKLLDDRNPHLADGIAALHARGQRVFAGVGALHMVGPSGLVTLLAQRGFTVVQIVPMR